MEICKRERYSLERTRRAICGSTASEMLWLELNPLARTLNSERPQPRTLSHFGPRVTHVFGSRPE